MLTELRLENYAVVDNLLVEFGPGLNLLTGETGAGKSILIDALLLLPGAKTRFRLYGTAGSNGQGEGQSRVLNAIPDYNN